MQIKTVFQNAVHRLKEADIQESELEVSLLLSHVLQMERTTVLLANEKILDDGQLALFEKSISRRLACEPLAYIIGEKEFWSLPFKVSQDVLIPRPETEVLLEKIIAVLRNSSTKPDQTRKILDLGTGSGVIAIILTLELAKAKVTAVDYSLNALKVARHNAKRHQVEQRINFINCNWLKGIMAKADFDAVITNPPYIDQKLFAKPFGRTTGSLQPEVGNFEPRLALDGGERGTQEIISIAREVGRVLKPGGWFFMEIGADQAKEARDIFLRTAFFARIEIFNDYAGLPRVFQAQKKDDMG